MDTFTFTDNHRIHKHILTLNTYELAAHLAKDPQFIFYWRKGWEPRLNALRSLYANPPSPKAIVAPHITEEQWVEIDGALTTLFNETETTAAE